MIRFIVLSLALLAASCTSSNKGPTLSRLQQPEPPPAEAEIYGDYLTARYAVLNKDPEEATKRYARSLEREPGNSEILEKAVYASLLSGDFGEAATIARSSRAHPVGVAPLARLTTAVDAYLDEDYALVISLLEGKDLGAYNAELAKLLIAWSQAANGDIEAALMRLSGEENEFVQQIHGFSQAYILAYAGRKQEALALLELGWSQGLRLPVAASLQLRLLLDEGREADAREMLSQIDVESASNTLMYDLDQRLDRGGAIPSVQMSAGEGAALSLVGPVATLSQRSVRDLSIVYLQLVQALDPEFRGVTIMIADRLADSGRVEQAIDLLNSIPKSSPYYSAAQVQRGWTCRRMRDDACGREAMEAALSVSPSRAIHVQAGDYFRAIEDYARAETILSSVAQRDAANRSDDWRVLFALGATLERLGDWERAEANLKAALEIEPDRPEVLNYLGYSWIDRGENIPAAFVMIRRALGQRPDAGYIVDSLGWAYYRLGKFDEAVLYLEQAAALDPGDPVVNDHLGDAYWRAGRKLEARYQWRRVKMLDPDEQTLKSVETKLDRGLPDGNISPGVGGADVDIGDMR